LTFFNIANGYPFAKLAGRKLGVDVWSENARAFERKRMKKQCRNEKIENAIYKN